MRALDETKLQQLNINCYRWGTLPRELTSLSLWFKERETLLLPQTICDPSLTK
jgi:hypothetical protein